MHKNTHRNRYEWSNKHNYPKNKHAVNNGWYCAPHDITINNYTHFVELK